VVWLYADGVDLILPDVQFGMVPKFGSHRGLHSLVADCESCSKLQMLLPFVI